MLYFSIALLQTFIGLIFKGPAFLFIFFMSVGKMFGLELTKKKKKGVGLLDAFTNAPIQNRINSVK